ncbi:metal ABC transporter ATP-binding protein [Microaceticoccus formicicus]|uniref:metal ABC transporter ATP-binding protein n=1 Tax=Microaceticoccus formicicus TaxID=3118105 RepID=UPI003CD03B72|nr:metal ABC transporter ATP-binding protein [Peptoniphilaceae bacterium AMB_02]
MNHVLIENLNFKYTSEKVIENLSMSIEEGQIVSISGENGSGKTTLLKLMLGQLKPDSGRVAILGKEISKINSFREIGYVPQIQITNQMAFPITVLELVVLNLYEDFGFFKIPKKKHKDKAIKLLKSLSLGQYINTPLNELSGGLRQRAMIARAMINNPKILVLDEPTSGVDKDSKKQFLELVSEMNKKHLLTTVIVTHEIDLIEEMLKIDKIYKMDNGGILDVTI